MKPLIRPAAVAGTWYPGSANALADAVDRHLAGAATQDLDGELIALIAPHAGLMYSGPVAAHAYRLLRDRTFDVVVLVGPSHFVGFDGVAAPAADAFETPFGMMAVDSDVVQTLVHTGAVQKFA
ncbi:MAG TPA: AmmeMemoRadiSam system protein B, partial [Pseudomonadales bacterium]|nr:AmmeMemoRadiSam system protein B [Pseudomonadales bacterium]